MSITSAFKTFRIRCRGVPRTHATSMMELFVTLVNSFQSLTNAIKNLHSYTSEWFNLCFIGNIC